MDGWINRMVIVEDREDDLDNQDNDHDHRSVIEVSEDDKST